MTDPITLQEAVREIVERHRRHVELSPGVGAECQAYGIAVCDDILNDLARVANEEPR